MRRIPSKKRQEVALHLYRIVNTKGENNQSEKDADVMWSSEHWVECGQGQFRQAVADWQEENSFDFFFQVQSMNRRVK